MLGRKLAAPRLLLELPAGRTKPINYIPGGASTSNVPNNFSASTQIDLSHGVVSDKSPSRVWSQTESCSQLSIWKHNMTYVGIGIHVQEELSKKS